jgi:SAM-dependent methyltransferase
MPKPDTIICAEVFEHCARLALFLQRAYEALAPGGLLVFTCAAPGRKPHGANGEPYLPPGEYYHNPTENELRVALRHFSEFHVIQFTKHADWFGVAWKGPGGA